MNRLMHPDDMLDFARQHQSDILRLIEADRVLKTRSEERIGLGERVLHGMNDLIITFRLRVGPKERKIVCSPTGDEAGLCNV